MKLFALGDAPVSPCMVMRFKGVTVMFDCGMDFVPMLSFLPRRPGFSQSARTTTATVDEEVQRTWERSAVTGGSSETGQQAAGATSAAAAGSSSRGGGGGGGGGDGSGSGSSGSNGSNGATATTRATSSNRGSLPPSKRARTGGSSSGAASAAAGAHFTSMGEFTLVSGASPQARLPHVEMVDMSTVDVIVATSFHSLLALPYVVERTGFRGLVLATDPSKQFGRLLMLELVHLLRSEPGAPASDAWKDARFFGLLPEALQESAESLRSVYTERAVENALAMVTAVSFMEKKRIFDLFTLMPAASGYGIGACNWVVSTEFERVVYLGPVALSPSLQHSVPLDAEPLKFCDVLIFSRIALPPVVPVENALGEFCSYVGATAMRGGNVLLPVHPCGLALELIEALHNHLANLQLPRVPIWFVSSAADSALAYAEISAEWLCRRRTDKIALGEPPFLFTEIGGKKGGRLHHARSASAPDFARAFREPCVVLASHPSLRCGAAVHFLDTWRHDPRHAVILVEPAFTPVMGGDGGGDASGSLRAEAAGIGGSSSSSSSIGAGGSARTRMRQLLAPFQPMAMKVFVCPLNTEMSASQASSLVVELKPRHVVVPQQFANGDGVSGGGGGGSSSHVAVPDGVGLSSYEPLDVVSVPLKRLYERGTIVKDLAAQLHPFKVPNRMGKKVRVAPVLASVDTHNNSLTMSVPSSAAFYTAGASRRRQLWGRADAAMLREKLLEKGLTKVRTSRDSETGATVVHVGDNVSVLVRSDATHVTTGSGGGEEDEEARLLVKEALKEIVSEF